MATLGLRSRRLLTALNCVRNWTPSAVTKRLSAAQAVADAKEQAARATEGLAQLRADAKAATCAAEAASARAAAAAAGVHQSESRQRTAEAALAAEQQQRREAEARHAKQLAAAEAETAAAIQQADQERRRRKGVERRKARAATELEQFEIVDAQFVELLEQNQELQLHQLNQELTPAKAAAKRPARQPKAATAAAAKAAAEKAGSRAEASKASQQQQPQQLRGADAIVARVAAVMADGMRQHMADQQAQLEEAQAKQPLRVLQAQAPSRQTLQQPADRSVHRKIGLTRQGRTGNDAACMSGTVAAVAAGAGVQRAAPAAEPPADKAPPELIHLTDSDDEEAS